MRGRIDLHVAAAGVLLALGVGAPALPAQGTVPPDTGRFAVRGLAAILLGEAALETERGGDAAAAARVTRAAAAVANGYRTVANDPSLTGDVIARAVTNFYAGRPGRSDRPSAVEEQLFRLMLLQAAQNARLIEQNDRVIASLQALGKR